MEVRELCDLLIEIGETLIRRGGENPGIASWRLAFHNRTYRGLTLFEGLPHPERLVFGPIRVALMSVTRRRLLRYAERNSGDERLVKTKKPGCCIRCIRFIRAICCSLRPLPGPARLIRDGLIPQSSWSGQK